LTLYFAVNAAQPPSNRTRAAFTRSRDIGPTHQRPPFDRARAAALTLIEHLKGHARELVGGALPHPLPGDAHGAG
jgi:hypothetical protein